MNLPTHSFKAFVRQPLAMAPLAMSLTVLVVVLSSVALIGIDPMRAPPPHIFQLLMAGQMPVLAFFAIKWLPRAPKQTMCVLALQAGAALTAMAPVFIPNL